jgi:hypothetical protein
MQKKRRAAALWQALHQGIKFNSPDSINRSLGNRTGSGQSAREKRPQNGIATRLSSSIHLVLML